MFRFAIAFLFLATPAIAGHVATYQPQAVPCCGQTLQSVMVPSQQMDMGTQYTTERHHVPVDVTTEIRRSAVVQPFSIDAAAVPQSQFTVGCSGPGCVQTQATYLGTSNRPKLLRRGDREGRFARFRIFRK